MLLLAAALVFASGCATPPAPGTLSKRTGDEMVVAGQFVHTGTPIVLWMDPGGYDAYRVERRFSVTNESDWGKYTFKDVKDPTPNRYGLRRAVLTDEQAERVRGGGWDLPLLQSVIDQFVCHFDTSGISRQCFKALHDNRDLSIHFMLDLDGTIYQTLDLKERAWHATTSNSRSIGIEIANIGAFPTTNAAPLYEWYKTNAQGEVSIQVPAQFGDLGFRTTNFVGHPARPEPITCRIQEQELIQYDFTPQQYRALSYLTAAICKVFPKIPCDYPRDDQGRLITHKLPDQVLTNYHGLLGHYHIQENKVDPGPAFQWEYVVGQAQKILKRNGSGRDAVGNARMESVFDRK